jgi:hypothetical protein
MKSSVSHMKNERKMKKQERQREPEKESAASMEGIY